MKISFFGRENPSERSSQKSFQELKELNPYRKPTQVDWYKYTKANERNFVKELGKTTRRKLARCLAAFMAAAVKDPRRLFTKNTGPC